MSNTTDNLSEDQKVIQREVGRSAPLGTPTQRKLTGIRRSVELGFLLVLQYQAKLSPGQWAYLMVLQRRVKLEELESSIELFRRLLSSKRSLARSEKDIQKVLARTPSLSPKLILREQRRIGVGYRDKGTLRLPHQDHDAPPRLWWWEDIAPSLHLSLTEDSPQDFLTEEDLVSPKGPPGSVLEILKSFRGTLYPKEALEVAQRTNQVLQVFPI
jgi:hypothetical protein